MFNVQGQYLKFKKAVDACKTGEWGPEEMRDFLLRSSNYLEPKAALIFDCINTEGYRDEAEDECTSAENGVDHYEQGMHEMWQYTEDGDLRHLDQGLKTIKKGNDLINKAMYLNREAYEEIDVQFFL